MDSDNENLPANQQMLKIAGSLSDIRDSMVMMSLALQDLLAASPSQQSDAAVESVQLLLDRWRLASNKLQS